ncbi:MAG: hypothetical protein ACHQF4_10665 [Sphingobacteriales bacterium]
MKNKTIAYFLIIAAIFTLSFTRRFSPGGLNRMVDDGVQKILELNLNDNPLTRGLSIYTFDVFDDTLYTANRGNFLKISLKSGKVSKNLKISNLLKEKFKSHIAADNIRVRIDGYYLSCLNELYFINRLGTVKKISSNDGYMINDFNIIDDKIIIASRGNKIKLISKNGDPISTLSFDMADDGHIPSYKGLCYDNVDNIYEFDVNKNNETVTKKYAGFSLIKEIKDPTVAFNSDKYFIGFSYRQRKNLYIFSKGSAQNQLIKKIALPQSYFDKQATPDEGQPDFRVSNNNGTNYLVLIYKRKLEVFRFNL